MLSDEVTHVKTIYIVIDSVAFATVPTDEVVCAIEHLLPVGPLQECADTGVVLCSDDDTLTRSEIEGGGST